jgi:hypothetical protein
MAVRNLNHLTGHDHLTRQGIVAEDEFEGYRKSLLAILPVGTGNLPTAQ